MDPTNNYKNATPAERVLYEVKKVIVGQDNLLERLIVALLARGHILVEGVPGLAKTMAIKTLAQAIGGEFKRIQFTPDLVPADLVGTRIYNQKTGEFNTSFGPVFTNLLLADEINRAPAKVQSALLEVMQEHQVTIAKQSYPMPEPFIVLATQNPIESDGTYPLPEAQLDRFLMKLIVDYPNFNDEITVIERATSEDAQLKAVIVPSQLVGVQKQVDEVYVDPRVTKYAATLVTATRKPKENGLEIFADAIQYGASPRGSIGLVTSAKALAFIRGRNYVLPKDIADLAPDVLRHRLVMSYDGIADGISPDSIIDAVMKRYPPFHMEMREKAT
jgi:MoxR-like ATPase